MQIVCSALIYSQHVTLHYNKVDYNLIENRKNDRIENTKDPNLIYLYFEGGFEDDFILLEYGNSFVEIDSVTTDQRSGLAHFEVIHNRFDSIQVMVFNGPGACIDLSKIKSNYWHFWFHQDTLRVQASRFAPTYE
jgi:hypothetical protein